MILSRETFYEIAAAWNLFSGRKFPSGNAEPEAGRIIVPGILIGFAAAVAAWSANILFGKIAAGFASAILFTLAYELLTGWNGLRNTAAFLALRLAGKRKADDGKTEIISGKGLTTASMLMSLYLLRALAIGMIAADAPSLFIPVFTAAYLIRFELVSFSGLLETDPSERAFAYRLTAAAFILAPLLSFHPVNFARVLLIAAAMILICVYQKRKISGAAEKIALRRISVSASASELILLYTALAVL